MQDGSGMVAGLLKIFWHGGDQSDEFERHLLWVKWDRGPRAVGFVLSAVVFYKNYFLFPYPYEFYCALMGEVPKKIRSVSHVCIL